MHILVFSGKKPEAYSHSLMVVPTVNTEHWTEIRSFYIITDISKMSFYIPKRNCCHNCTVSPLVLSLLLSSMQQMDMGADFQTTKWYPCWLCLAASGHSLWAYCQKSNILRYSFPSQISMKRYSSSAGQQHTWYKALPLHTAPSLQTLLYNLCCVACTSQGPDQLPPFLHVE